MGTDPGPNLDPNHCLTVDSPEILKIFFLTLKNDLDPGGKPVEDKETRRIRQAS